MREWALNTTIAYMTFDGIFEGSSKYYKDPQTFLKRAKEVQMGGIPYASSFDDMTSENITPILDLKGQEQIIYGRDKITPLIPDVPTYTNGGIQNRTLVARNGFRAITIKNSETKYAQATQIYETLKDITGEEVAKNIALEFGDVKIGNTTLVEGTDYTVNEITSITDVGTRTVTIQGIGKYTGTASTDYTITARNITGATITLSSTVLTYTGFGQKPSVNSVHFGGHELNATNDYTVTNPDRTDANTTSTPTYTVTVNGQGNFTGSATTTYKIDPKPITSDMVTISPFTFTYNGNNQKPTSITVHDADRGVDLTNNTDYVVTNNGIVIVKCLCKSSLYAFL